MSEGTEQTQVSDEDLVALEAALAEFEVPEEVVEQSHDEAQIEDAVEAEIVKAEIYESQDAGATVGEASEEPAKAPKKAKEPKEKKAKEPKAPKIERDLANLDDAVFQRNIGEKADKAGMLAMRPKQKKIAEKFDNLFQSFAAG